MILWIKRRKKPKHRLARRGPSEKRRTSHRRRTAHEDRMQSRGAAEVSARAGEQGEERFLRDSDCVDYRLFMRINKLHLLCKNNF